MQQQPIELRSGRALLASLSEPPPRLPPGQAAAAFAAGVRAVLLRWTCLRLAVENGWGGDQARARRLRPVRSLAFHSLSVLFLIVSDVGARVPPKPPTPPRLAPHAAWFSLMWWGFLSCNQSGPPPHSLVRTQEQHSSFMAELVYPSLQAVTVGTHLRNTCLDKKKCRRTSERTSLSRTSWPTSPPPSRPSFRCAPRPRRRRRGTASGAPTSPGSLVLLSVFYPSLPSSMAG